MRPRAACMACKHMASSPSRLLANISTGLCRRLRSALPSATCAASGRASNLKLPGTPRTGASSARKRSASAALWAQTPASALKAGPLSQDARWYACKDAALKRAFTRYTGTPACAQPARSCGHTSVSIKRPISGAVCCRKRRTAPGESQGCQTCTSPGCSRATPAARPVAVPWVSTRRMPGIALRKAATNRAAARVSPSDTACTQTRRPGPCAAAPGTSAA